MTTWRDRLKKRFAELKAEKKATQESIAHEVGISQSAFAHWLNGRRSPENLADYEKLARAIDMTPAELLYGDEIEPPSNVSDGPETKGLVPLISWVQAGQWSEAIDLFEPYEADEFYPCPASHGTHTYALRVEGDSMTSPVGRSYPEGALIYVDPEQRSVAPGNRVIAKRSGENGVTFKQLAKDGDRMYLKPLNPNHPPIFDEFKILGKVIGMWMDE